MAIARSIRVLIVQTGPSCRQAAVAFSTAGLAAEVVSEANLAARLQGEAPHLVWVHADLGGKLLVQLLGLLQATEQTAALPVVVVSADARDALFVAQARTGVVEILPAPFDPAPHTARLAALLSELGTRTGVMGGSCVGRDFISLFAHLKGTLRSGELVAQVDDEEARLYYFRGELKSASLGELRGPPVRARLATLTAPTRWTFSDGLAGADGFVDIGEVIEGEVEQTEDEPLGLAAPVPAPARAGPFAVGLEAGPSAPAAGAATTPVLVVDDDTALAQLLQAFFSKKGYPVKVAHDGVEALELLAKHRFEVVIADLNMPNLDGWGLLKAVRGDFHTHETLVALFSCHDDYRESLRAMHAGAQAYYPKTLKLSALEAQVRELCEPRRRFQRLLESRQSLSLNLSALGPQWALRAIAQAGLTAQLDAFDGWCTWRGHFVGGQLHQLSARTEAEASEGERALVAFLGSRTLEGSLAFETPPVASAFGGAGTEQLLTRAVAAMNEAQQHQSDALLREAQQLDVNAELYRLYATVGPPAWLAIAKALCEERLLPREVMARLGVSPGELGAALKDLIRRRVVTLKR